MIFLPRLYAILDASCFPDREHMLGAAEEWVRSGVTLMQYRDKSGDPPVVLTKARDIKSRFSDVANLSRASLDRAGEDARLHTIGTHLNITLIINDRPDLCLAAEFNGVHVGQDDLSAESARKIIGRARWLGVSTHNPDQVARAEDTSADYIAVGPIFATASKAKPDPVIGLAGLTAARKLTGKPLVAIGGINRKNCLSVIDAGADSVAVISDLVSEPAKSATEFLQILM